MSAELPPSEGRHVARSRHAGRLSRAYSWNSASARTAARRTPRSLRLERNGKAARIVVVRHPERTIPRQGGRSPPNDDEVSVYLHLLDHVRHMSADKHKFANQARHQ